MMNSEMKNDPYDIGYDVGFDDGVREGYNKAITFIKEELFKNLKEFFAKERE